MVKLFRRSSAIALADVASPARRGASTSAVSASGVAHFGGILYYPYERDRAWQSQTSRDETILAMGNSSILGGVLLQIEMFIRRVPWHLEPPDDSPEADKVATFYQDCLDDLQGLWPGAPMAHILTYLQWGWSALEIVYKQRDDGRIGWHSWRLIPQYTRYGWEFDPMGDPSALIQLNIFDNTRPQLITIPLSKLLHFRFASRDNSPEGLSPLRLAHEAFYFRSAFQTLEGILFERFGGLQVARLPTADIEAKNPTYQEVQRMVTTLGVNAQSGLILSSETDDTGKYLQDFEIVSPGGDASVPTADAIIRRYANEEVGVLGANVTRTGQDGTGSYALADVQGGMFQQNMAAHLDTIGDGIQTQEFPRLARLNGIDPALIPTLKHGDIEDADLAALGAYLDALGKAGLLEDSPELRVYVHEEAGLPVPSLDELKAKQIAAKKSAAAALKRPPMVPGMNGNSPGATGATGAAQSANGVALDQPPMMQAAETPADDGMLTEADKADVIAWWKSVVEPEEAGLLEATVISA